MEPFNANSACRLAWSLLVLLAGMPLPSASRVVLSEVMYDPEGADYHTEYVELVNIGDTTTDIGGWRVGDGKELDEIVGDDLALKAGQYALVLDGSYAGAAISTYESLPAEALVVAIDDKAFGLRGWSNSVASTVVLRDAAGDTVETFSYSLLRQPGRSYEKVALAGPPSSGNWMPSRYIGGTPGRLNSTSEDGTETERLRLLTHPNPFLGSLTVEYYVSETPAIVNVWVYDVEGNLLRKLLDNAEAGPTDTVVWDGLDESGSTVPVGAYILYASASVQGRFRHVKTVVIRGAEE